MAFQNQKDFKIVKDYLLENGLFLQFTANKGSYFETCTTKLKIH